MLLAATQCLNGLMLLAALGAASLFGKRTIYRIGRLVWRTCWLLFPLPVVFAWAAVGDPLWGLSGTPVREGVHEAMTHLGCLAMVLMLVAAFFDGMPMADAMIATRSMRMPPRRFDLEADRGVVRLMPVLRYAETLPRPHHSKNQLAEPEMLAAGVVEFRRIHFGGYDAVAALPLALLVAFYGLI